MITPIRGRKGKWSKTYRGTNRRLEMITPIRGRKDYCEIIVPYCIIMIRNDNPDKGTERL